MPQQEGDYITGPPGKRGCNQYECGAPGEIFRLYGFLRATWTRVWESGQMESQPGAKTPRYQKLGDAVIREEYFFTQKFCAVWKIGHNLRAATSIRIYKGWTHATKSNTVVKGSVSPGVSMARL